MILHFIHKSKVGFMTLMENPVRPFFNLTGYELEKFLRGSTNYLNIAPLENDKILSAQEISNLWYHRTADYDLPNPRTETLIDYEDINLERVEKNKIIIKRDAWIDKYIIPVKTRHVNNDILENYMTKYVNEFYKEAEKPNTSCFIAVVTNEAYSPQLVGVIDFEAMEKNDNTVTLNLYGLNYLIAKIKDFTKWYIFTDQIGGRFEDVSYGDPNDTIELGTYITQPKNRMKELLTNTHYHFSIPVKYNNLEQIDLDYLNVNDYKAAGDYTMANNAQIKWEQSVPRYVTGLLKASYAIGGIGSCIVCLYYGTTDNRHIFGIIRVRNTPLSFVIERMLDDEALIMRSTFDYTYEAAYNDALYRIKELYGQENFTLLNNGILEMNQSTIDSNSGESFYTTEIYKNDLQLIFRQKGKFFGKRIVFDNDPSVKIDDMISIILKRSRATLFSDGLFGINLKQKDITNEHCFIINRKDIIIRNRVRLLPEEISVSVFDKLDLIQVESDAVNTIISKETNDELEKYDEEAEAILKNGYPIETGVTLMVENEKYLVVEMVEENGLIKCNVWHKCLI